jgi:hypothetical protein
MEGRVGIFAVILGFLGGLIDLTVFIDFSRRLYNSRSPQLASHRLNYIFFASCGFCFILIRELVGKVTEGKLFGWQIGVYDRYDRPPNPCFQ